MDLTLSIDTEINKSQRYESILPQVKSLIKDEPDITANLGNITSVLKYSFLGFSWVGFYLIDNNQNELVLNVFQGKPACTRIRIGKGVCGTSVERKETIVVPDVGEFPGHIYCDPDSKSEIVIPIIVDGNVVGVLDIDSNIYSYFDETDKLYLEQLIKEITYLFKL